MPTNSTRYVLAIGQDALVVESTDGVAIIERLPGIVLAETDVATARALAARGGYVHVYSAPHTACEVSK